MLSAGQDLRLKLWDIRTFKEIHSYNTFHPASSISISDRGLAAIGAGNSVTIWKDLFTTTNTNKPSKIQSPYLSWHHTQTPTPISRVTFCPYEDILGISHTSGFSSIHVPGSGEPNFDFFEANPYETVKQRQESEVKALLNKLQPETIALDPDFVGKLDVRSAEQRALDKDLDAPKRDELARLRERELKERNRGRGKNSAVRRFLRKKGGRNVIDEKRLKLEALRRERKERFASGLGREKVELGPALARFVRREP